MIFHDFAWLVNRKQRGIEQMIAFCKKKRGYGNYLDFSWESDNIINQEKYFRVLRWVWT
jgi:hypothetical protein